MLYHHSRGFTLLEILIAIFILSIVLTTVFASYSGTLRVIKEIEEESRIYKMARITLDRMNRDLSSLQRSGNKFVLRSERSSAGSREFGFLAFWSASHLVFEKDELPGSPASIVYFVKQDKEGGFSLWRSDIAQARPSSENRTDRGVIICQDLQAMNFRFFDESGREHDNWDTRALSPPQKDKPPAMIQIELMLANGRDAEKPYKFITKIFLPVRK